jgi:hypothetical protein
MLHIQKKFWSHVEEALINIEETSSYYAGGTLSVSLGKGRGICLNISGKGFVLSKIKDARLYLPDHITKLVREIYLKYRGETDYYKEVVNNG